MLRRQRSCCLKRTGELVGNGGPAESIVVDVGAVAAQQRLMREEAVFALVDGDAEPVAAADGRLDLQQQLAADGEEAAADAADAARPVLGDFVEMEGRVVDEGLDGGDDALVGIADADAAADRADAGSEKQAVSSRMASGWKMQSESMEMISSALESWSALQTVRALPQLTSLRPQRMRMLVKSRWALSIHW